MNKTTIKDGPLTDRQVQIIEGLLNGKTQKHIAQWLKAPVPADGSDAPAYGVNVGVVRQEVATIKTKMGADTLVEAIGMYATAIAHQNVATQVLSNLVRDPIDPAELHLNQVLSDLAAQLRDWAAQRLPK